MATHSPSSGPLFDMFRTLIDRDFRRSLGIADSEVVDYLAGVLAEFAHFDRVHRIRDLQGRPLDQVGEMLMEASVQMNASSFEREREVHKHIGDYTLFWTGVFPEALRMLQAADRKDHLIDYIEQGKSSYYIASTFDHGDYAAEARVLRCLSHIFEPVAFGLYQVRGAWEAAAQRQRYAMD